MTPKGKATITLLRLNRPALVNFRLQRKTKQEEADLLRHYQEVIGLLGNMNRELATLAQEQRALLEKQQQILELLLRDDGE